MSGILVRKDGKYWGVWCQGCKELHIGIPIHGHSEPGKNWVWNEEAKTLTPSVRHYVEDPDTKAQTTTCHYNVTGGRILYHGDGSNHKLSGIFDIPELPEGKMAYYEDEWRQV